MTGKWRAHGQKANPKPLKPATVNRELDTLKSILSKAVEWGKLVESPARGVKRLRVDNRRTRILTEDEQRAILESAPRKMRAFITLALITAARAGELLGLRWEHVTEDALLLLETKNGKPRRIPLSPSARAVLATLPRVPGRPYVFTNAATADRYTVNGALHVFRRAVVRAGIRTGDVTLHTLRHTAISRMIEKGHQRSRCHGDQRAQLDAHARTLHAPHGRPEAGGRGHLHRGHKLGTFDGRSQRPIG